MKMRNDRVLVEMDKPAEISKGGIVMPKSREKQTTGTVVTSGPGSFNSDGVRLETGVTAGDRVMLSSYAGSDIKLGGKELRVVSADDIMAVLEAGDTA